MLVQKRSVDVWPVRSFLRSIGYAVSVIEHAAILQPFCAVSSVWPIYQRPRTSKVQRRSSVPAFLIMASTIVHAHYGLQGRHNLDKRDIDGVDVTGRTGDIESPQEVEPIPCSALSPSPAPRSPFPHQPGLPQCRLSREIF